MLGDAGKGFENHSCLLLHDLDAIPKRKIEIFAAAVLGAALRFILVRGGEIVQDAGRAVVR